MTYPEKIKEWADALIAISNDMESQVGNMRKDESGDWDDVADDIKQVVMDVDDSAYGLKKILGTF